MASEYNYNSTSYLKQFLNMIKSIFINGNNKFITISFIGLIIYISLFFHFIGIKKKDTVFSLVSLFIFIFSVIAILLYTIVKYKGNPNLRNRFGRLILYSIFGILFSVGVFLLLKYAFRNSFVLSLSSYILLLLALCGLIFILLFVFINSGIYDKIKYYMRRTGADTSTYNIFTRMKNWIKFFSRIIYNDIKNTSWTTYIIFLCSVIFIIGWLIHSYIAKKIYAYKGTILLNEPVYTDKINSIKTGKIIEKYERDLEQQFKNINSSKNKELNYTYAISCWVYIGNQGANMSNTSSNYTTIFRYGQTPVIKYNAENNTIMITSRTSIDNIETLYTSNSFKHQKWNNFIFNYDGGQVDVFLNGDLVSTHNDILPFKKLDDMQVGNQDGVKGGVCNIVYFDYTLSKLMIDFLYNGVKHNNPPIIN